MKRLHKILYFLLCVMLLAIPMQAFAEDPDDPDDPYELSDVTDFDDEDVPDVTTPDVTAPHGTLTTERTTKPTTTKPQKTVDPPLVKITREDLSSKPKAGDTFTMTVVFHNYSGAVSLRSGLASFEPSDGLTLVENSASKVVPSIGMSGVRSVQIKLRVAKDVSSASQSVSVSYAYSYQTPDGLVQAEASEKLLLTVVPNSSAEESSASATSSATPNIIVTDYNYGGTVAAGDTFTLRIQFQNTSKKLGVENIVMSVDTGSGIAITSASNTYYYASLGAGKTQAQSIPMRVAVNADPEGAKIDIAFRYEYVDAGERSSSSASESLSIPIYIPDRFTVSAPDMELIGMQNEELSVSLPYINKSRVDVNNVSAELIYDEGVVFCEQPHVNLGNFESGKSGTIDFYFTPLDSGSGSVAVRVTYEDELMQEKELLIDVPYSADEGYSDPGMDEPTEYTEEEPTGHVWLRYAIPAAVIVVVAVVIILIVRKHKKKKKAAQTSIDFDWASPQEVKTHEDQ